MKLNCPFCFPDAEKTLSPITKAHSEHYLSVLTNDGTKKWYCCSNCNGLYCRDKMRAVWQFSPQTYTDFLAKGLLTDKLNG